MKVHREKELELIEELESAYQKVYIKEAQLKEHGHREGIGTARYQTMSDVRESEVRYRRLFETAKDGILILDAETGAITDANPYITDSLGYSLQELLGKRLWEIGAFVDVKDSKDAFEELQRKEYIRYEDLPLKTKDGHSRQVEFVSNVYLVNGNRIIQCNIRDITDRRIAEQSNVRAEESMRESEERYRRLFETAQDGILILDAGSGAITDANPFIMKLLGYALEDLIGKRLWEIGAFADVKDNKAAFEELQRKEYIRYDDLPLKTKDGTLREVEFVSNAYLVNTKKVIQCNIRDITDRKQVEVALKESEGLYRTMVEWSPESIAITRGGKILFINPAAVKMMGATSGEELLGKQILDMVHPDFHEIVCARMKHNAEFGGVLPMVTQRFIKLDGTVIDVENQGITINYNGKPAIFSSIRDVTEKKKAEKGLRESEERFSNAYEYAPNGIALVSPDGNWLKVNKALCDLFGYSAAELLTLTFQDITHPDDLAIDLENVRRMIAGEIRSYQMEKRYIHKLGHRITVLLNVSLVRDERGEPRYFISQIQDITARKEVENSLRESNEKFHQLADNITDAFWIRSPDMNRVHYISPAFERIWGRTVESLYANPEEWPEFIIPEDRETVISKFAALSNDSPRLDIEYRISRPDGEIRWVHVRGFQVRDGFDKLVRHIGIVSDITNRKRGEVTLQESERKYRFLFENNPHPMWVYDLKTLAFLTVNDSAIEKYGYTREEFLSMTIADIRPKEDVSRLMEDVALQRSTLEHAGDWRHVLKNGTIIDVEITSHSIQMDKHDSALVVAHDITERKRNELERQVIFEITQSVTTTSNLDELLKLFNQALKRIMYAENCFVALHDPDTGLFSFPHFEDKYDPAPEPSAMEKSCAAYVFRTGKPFLLTQALFERLVEQNEVELIGTNSPSWLGVPLQTPSRIIGVLVVQHYEKENVYSERDVQFLHSIGSQIALAIESKRVEEDLRESEEMFRRLFNESADPILLLDDKSNFTKCNPSTISLLGYSSEENVLTKKPWDLSPEKQPDGSFSSEKAELMISNAISSGYNRFEWIHTKSDGSDLPVEVLLTPIKLKGKQFIYTVWRDITERKQAEESLRASEEKYRMIVETSAEGMWMVDKAWKTTYVNPAMANMIGYAAGEMLGRSPMEFVDQEETPNISGMMQRREKGITEKTEVGMRRKDGTLMWTYGTSVSILNDKGEFVGGLSLVTDITERKHADEVLKKSEEKFRTLVETLPDGFYRSTAEGRFLDVNQAMVKMLGYDSKEELLQIDIPTQLYFHRDDRKPDHVNQDFTTDTEDYQLRKKDGTGIWVEDRSHYILDGSGKIQFHEGVCRDITDRKSAEQQITLLAHTMQSITECVSVTDMNDTILFVNNAFLKRFGYSQHEMVGKNINIVRSPNNPPEDVRGILAATMAGGWSGELLNRTKEGHEFSVFLSTSCVRDENGQAVALVGVAKDMTDQKKLQQQLLQSQKSESIGTLAGGIAHDFNNILAIILGYTFIIERGLLSAEKLSESIAAINQAVKRGAALVRQILTFARKTEISFEPLHLEDLIGEIVSMLKQTFPKIISFKEIFSQDIPFILADRSQIHQTLLNLCVNARDAMPKGGTITVKTEMQTGAQLKKQFPSVNEDMYVCIAVSDTGEGMDQTTRSRVFDPFFTTKPLGKGTGLGLSVVYGVVQSHKGFINVESGLGKGTTFRLYFPIPTISVKVIESKQEETFDDGGTETILIVEDESLLQDTLRSLLESRGYKILVANDGAEAIEMYKKHQQVISLVFTDLGLPVMTGMEEFKLLKKINPDVKVIFASGFFDPDIRSELLKAGGKHFLQKPYMADEILQTIREALNKK